MKPVAAIAFALTCAAVSTATTTTHSTSAHPTSKSAHSQSTHPATTHSTSRRATSVHPASAHAGLKTAQKAPQKTPQKAGAVRSGAKSTSPGKHQVLATGRSRGKHGRVSYVAARGPSLQAAPSPERYQEIQQALASRGFYKGEVNGTWGPDSVDALKQFQTAQNLPNDGKISSLSLIGLGLGPSHAYPGGVAPKSAAAPDGTGGSSLPPLIPAGNSSSPLPVGNRPPPQTAPPVPPQASTAPQAAPVPSNTPVPPQKQ